jgi:hypothetical protein
VRLIFEQFLSLPRVTLTNLLSKYDGEMKRTSALIFSILYEEKTVEQLKLAALAERCVIASLLCFISLFVDVFLSARLLSVELTS